MNYLKDCIWFFLQITATLVLFATLWSHRKPLLRLGTPLIVFNLDKAIANPIYGPEPCISAVADRFISPQNDVTRIHSGLRPSLGEIEVLKEFANWKPTQTYFSGNASQVDSDERWTDEIGRFSENFSITSIARSLAPHFPESPKSISFKRDVLGDLPLLIGMRYGYDLHKFEGYENKSGVIFGHTREEQDVWEDLLEKVKEICKTPKETAKTLWAIGHAGKTLNLVQIKNPYHEGFGKIHLRIEHAFMGTMTLIESVATREGFEILNNSRQYLHLVLDELPPYTSRYLVVETSMKPLTLSCIEIQTGVLQRLSPKVIKTIAFIAALISVSITLLVWRLQ